MPRLRMTTGHVDDIMNIALLVWGIASKHDALARGSASVSSAVSAATAQSVLRLPFLRYDNNNCGPDMLLQEREHSIDAESRKFYLHLVL